MLYIYIFKAFKLSLQNVVSQSKTSQGCFVGSLAQNCEQFTKDHNKIKATAKKDISQIVALITGISLDSDNRCITVD